MNFSLVKIKKSDLAEFKKDMQKAFQKGFEDKFRKTENTILPEKDIDKSLDAKGSIAYKAIVDGETVGGAVVVIDENDNVIFSQLVDEITTEPNYEAALTVLKS